MEKLQGPGQEGGHRKGLGEQTRPRRETETGRPPTQPRETPAEDPLGQTGAPGTKGPTALLRPWTGGESVPSNGERLQPTWNNAGLNGSTYMQVFFSINMLETFFESPYYCKAIVSLTLGYGKAAIRL